MPRLRWFYVTPNQAALTHASETNERHTCNESLINVFGEPLDYLKALAVNAGGHLMRITFFLARVDVGRPTLPERADFSLVQVCRNLFVIPDGREETVLSDMFNATFVRQCQLS